MLLLITRIPNYEAFFSPEFYIGFFRHECLKSRNFRHLKPETANLQYYHSTGLIVFISEFQDLYLHLALFPDPLGLMVSLRFHISSSVRYSSKSPKKRTKSSFLLMLYCSFLNLCRLSWRKIYQTAG